MSPRPPSARIIMDSNILISAVLGSRSMRSIARVASIRALLTSVQAQAEARETIRRVAPHPAKSLAAAAKLFLFVQVEDQPEAAAPEAANILRNAPASRNGSTKDAHLLALAWYYDADIWSHDRDFAGTGWPCWSSANLVAALAEPAA